MSTKFPLRRALFAASVLAGLGLAGIALRDTLGPDERIPAGDSVWQLTWTITVDAKKKGALLKLSPPWNTKHNRVFAQHISHPGARIIRATGTSRTRQIVAVSTRSGKIRMDAVFDTHLSNLARRSGTSSIPLSVIDREMFLSPESDIQVDDETVMAIADGLRINPDSSVAHEIFRYVTDRISRDENGPVDAVTVIKEGTGTSLGRIRTAVALFRAAKIPARVVTGFTLKEGITTQPRHWLEIYADDRWQQFDPEFGYENEVPPSYIPVRRGGDNIFTLSDADIVETRYTIARTDAPPGLFGEENKRLIDIVNLERLPIGARETLAILLLLPFGALVTTYVRTVLGVHTYGTFTPTLLALAATAVDWLSATLIFLLVTSISIAGRSLLPKLKLSRTARLTIVFSLVALSLALGVSLMMYYGLSPGGESVLLPIVVLTTLVDRIYTLADSKGIQVALVRLAWTFATACLCFYILLQSAWGEWVVGHPEVHLVTIALVICARIYTGPKLSHQSWMRWFVEPVTPDQPKSDTPT